MGPSVRIAVSILGVVACLAGGVFFLQGVGILGGSFMSNTVTWTVIGVAMVVGGAALLRLGRDPRGNRSGRG